MFSALRQGAPFFILEKGETPNIKIGQVESVTQPRPKYGTYNPVAGYLGNVETIVDISVKINGDKKDYIGIPSNASVHQYGNITVSESRDAMIAEIGNMLQASKSIVDSVDYHRKMISSYEEMLKQLNPAFAKEQQRDDAIDTLKVEVESLRKEIAKVANLLTKAETI